MSNSAYHALDRCDDLKDPELVNFAISALIILGLVISYVPQMYRIIERRTSEGLSSYFIMLGAVAGTCAVANILTLPESRDDMRCCKHISAFACSSALLGIAQIGLQWACFFVIMFLFIIFLPRRAVQDSHTGTVRAEGSAITGALVLVAVAITHFMFTFVVSVVFLARFPKYIGQWANFLGVCASILAAIQYLPQIYTTWNLQDIGSLSIPMMCIQTPGGFLFAASLYFRYGAAGWSVWATYILLASLQGCLLVMALYFEYFGPANKNYSASSTSPQDGPHDDPDDEGSHHVEGEGDDERSPLLARDPGRRLSYQGAKLPRGLSSNLERNTPSSARQKLSSTESKPSQDRKPSNAPRSETLSRPQTRKFGTVA